MDKFCRLSGATCLGEQCGRLKSTLRDYIEAFELERKSRMKMKEILREYKKRVEDQETSIRKLTSRLRAGGVVLRKEINGRNENAYLDQADCAPLLHVRFIQPCHPTDEQISNQTDQHKAAIPAVNERQIPLLYGNMLKAGYPERL